MGVLVSLRKSYSYTYYPNGLKKTYTNPEGITYTYYYTKHDELAAVQIPGEGQIGFTDFYWQVPQTILLPGGSKITLNYDQFLQVEERLLEDPASTELANALYEYDLENNITRITEQFGSLIFDYDSLYRLTKADYPWEATEYRILSSGEQFDYDGVGNRTVYRKDQSPDELVLSYNDHNQLVGSGDGAVFSYNANGHTVRKVQNGQTTDYIYNREERLVEVKTNGSIVGQYSYNPYGQRIRKIANGQTIWFLYNDEGLAAEYDASGNLIKEYHFKPYGPWMTEPLFQRAADGGVYYYQNDHLGTPQRMVDKSGAVVWEARYEAFGKAEVLKEQVGNNLRFPGQYYDQETGLHHNYFRDYDSELGRYIQSDPIGLKGGINTYRYARSNALIMIDPDGLKTVDDGSSRLKKFKKVPVCMVSSAAEVNMQTELEGALKQRDEKLNDIRVSCKNQYDLCAEKYPCGGTAMRDCIREVSKQCRKEQDDAWDVWSEKNRDIDRRYWHLQALERGCDTVEDLGL